LRFFADVANRCSRHGLAHGIEPRPAGNGARSQFGLPPSATGALLLVVLLMPSRMP
jgi:hypothetical protein